MVQRTKGKKQKCIGFTFHDLIFKKSGFFALGFFFMLSISNTGPRTAGSNLLQNAIRDLK